MSLSTLFQNIREHQIKTSDIKTADALTPTSAIASFREFEAEILEFAESLNFDETGIALKNILQKVYQVGEIDGFENVRVIGNTIKGIFYENLSPTLSKRFEFTASPTGIFYELVNADSLENANYSEFGEFDYAIVSYVEEGKKRKSHNCREGVSKPCTRPDGSVYCISKGFRCPPERETASQKRARTVKPSAEDAATLQKIIAKGAVKSDPKVVKARISKEKETELEDKITSAIASGATVSELQKRFKYPASKYGDAPETNPVNRIVGKLRDRGLAEVGDDGKVRVKSDQRKDVGTSSKEMFSVSKAKYREGYSRVQPTEKNETGYKRIQERILENLGASYSNREGYLLPNSKVSKLKELAQDIDKKDYELPAEKAHLLRYDPFNRFKGKSGLEAFKSEIHKKSVESALNDGKTVPDAVLKQYPDLAEKYRGSAEVGNDGRVRVKSGKTVDTSRPISENRGSQDETDMQTTKLKPRTAAEQEADKYDRGITDDKTARALGQETLDSFTKLGYKPTAQEREDILSGDGRLFDSAYQSLQENTKSLRATKVNEIRKQQSDLQGQIDDLAKQQSDLEAQISKTTERGINASARAEVKRLMQGISSGDGRDGREYRNRVRPLEAQVKDLQSQQDELKQKRSQLEREAIALGSETLEREQASKSDRTSATQPKYYDTLPEEQKQKLFAEMRDIQDKIDGHRAKEKTFKETTGTVNVGAREFDYFIKAHTLESYQRALRDGKTPDDALAYAKSEARDAIAKHNAKRPKDVNWQRSDITADSMIENVHRNVKAVVEPKSDRTPTQSDTAQSDRGSEVKAHELSSDQFNSMRKAALQKLKELPLNSDEVVKRQDALKEKAVAELKKLGVETFEGSQYSSQGFTYTPVALGVYVNRSALSKKPKAEDVINSIQKENSDLLAESAKQRESALTPLERDIILPGKTHSGYVFDALSKGVSVPDSVLSEYPEMAARYNRKPEYESETTKSFKKQIDIAERAGADGKLPRLREELARSQREDQSFVDQQKAYEARKSESKPEPKADAEPKPKALKSATVKPQTTAKFQSNPNIEPPTYTSDRTLAERGEYIAHLDKVAKSLKPRKGEIELQMEVLDDATGKRVKQIQKVPATIFDNGIAYHTEKDDKGRIKKHIITHINSGLVLAKSDTGSETEAKRFAATVKDAGLDANFTSISELSDREKTVLASLARRQSGLENGNRDKFPVPDSFQTSEDAKGKKEITDYGLDEFRKLAQERLGLSKKAATDMYVNASNSRNEAMQAKAREDLDKVQNPDKYKGESSIPAEVRIRNQMTYGSSR